MIRLDKGDLYYAWFALGLVAFSICHHYHGFNWSYAGNGIIEFFGSVMLLKNVLQLYADKMVRGYHWLPAAFWMGWGYWNLHYYPYVNDWYSFTGGMFVVAVNTFWLGQMWYYRKN